MTILTLVALFIALVGVGAWCFVVNEYLSQPLFREMVRDEGDAPSVQKLMAGGPGMKRSLVLQKVRTAMYMRRKRKGKSDPLELLLLQAGCGSNRVRSQWTSWITGVGVAGGALGFFLFWQWIDFEACIAGAFLGSSCGLAVGFAWLAMCARYQDAGLSESLPYTIQVLMLLMRTHGDLESAMKAATRTYGLRPGAVTALDLLSEISPLRQKTKSRELALKRIAHSSGNFYFRELVEVLIRYDSKHPAFWSELLRLQNKVCRELARNSSMRSLLELRDMVTHAYCLHTADGRLRRRPYNLLLPLRTLQFVAVGAGYYSYFVGGEILYLVLISFSRRRFRRNLRVYLRQVTKASLKTSTVLETLRLTQHRASPGTEFNRALAGVVTRAKTESSALRAINSVSARFSVPAVDRLALSLRLAHRPGAPLEPLLRHIEPGGR